MRRFFVPTVALASLTAAGCLGPLVEDEPGASVHVLPPGAAVPGVDEDPELLRQITVHDGLDDEDLEENGGVVLRIEGFAGGDAIAYWSFGEASRNGAPLYVIVEETSGGPVRLVEHPYLLDTIPGDPTYGPIRRIQHVRVTARYRGELITSVEALADAIDLGLVEEPEPTGTWVNLPVVPPGTLLEVGGAAGTAEPVAVFAHGHRVDAFELGGARGVQPMSRSGFVPVGQAAQLAEAGSLRFDKGPVFQYVAPAQLPGEAPNYAALVTLVEVRLADGVVADESIRSDADLFRRSMTGSITGVTEVVDEFVVTERIVNWPLQFEEGSP